MIRRALGSGFLAVAAGVLLLLLSAHSAHALFDVKESGKTTTVTQLDTTKLFVIVNGGGDIVVNDGVTVVGFPPATNLVVRGADAITLSRLEVRLHEALPGSLTLDLPGFNEVELRGTNVTIEGSLKVKGSYSSTQILRVGEPGSPVTIKGDVKLDLRDGYDRVQFVEATSILGTFTGKGVNELMATSLEVGNNFSLDVKRESHPLNVTVTSELVIGKTLSLSGGKGIDNIGVIRGSVGGSVKIKLGDGGAGSQLVQAMFGLVGGGFNVQMGAGQQNVLILPNSMVVQGSLNVTTLADQTACFCNARIEGTAIKYVGGAGRDIVYSQLVAPSAKAAFKLGGGDDVLVLEAPPQLTRLDADFGDGVDVLDNRFGFTLPPGKIVGLP